MYYHMYTYYILHTIHVLYINAYFHMCVNVLGVHCDIYRSSFNIS
jgi:hypothetical protein